MLSTRVDIKCIYILNASSDSSFHEEVQEYFFFFLCLSERHIVHAKVKTCPITAVT